MSLNYIYIINVDFFTLSYYSNDNIYDKLCQNVRFIYNFENKTNFVITSDLMM